MSNANKSKGSDKAFLITAVKHINANSKTNPGGANLRDRAVLAGIIFALSEAVAMIMRKNFGMNGYNPLSLFISVVIFVLVSVLSILGYFQDDDLDGYATPISFLITGVFYSVLAFTTVFKWVICTSDAKNKGDHSYCNGDSYLKFLEGEIGVSGVKLFAEPILFIAIGVAFSFCNLIGGIVLILCGVAVWAKALLEWALASPFQSVLDSGSNGSQTTYRPK